MSDQDSSATPASDQSAPAPSVAPAGEAPAGAAQGYAAPVAAPYGQVAVPLQGQLAPQHVTVVVQNPKSTAVAYLLWFFLGSLGIHKFYVNKTGMGITYLALSIIGWATTMIFIGWALLAVVWIMLLVDLFTLAGQVRNANGTNTPQATVTTT
jgi:TM2 domain-containing membrane protein YozV